MPDRNGKIFYTSITSLSHISKLFEDATNKGITKGIGIGIEKGRAEEKIETNTINLRSIMVNLNLNADQAMDALSIDEKDRDFYREKLASLSKN